MERKILFINSGQFGYQAGYPYYVKYLQPYFDILFVCHDLGLKKVESQHVDVRYIPLKGNILMRTMIWLISLIKLIAKQDKYTLIYMCDFKLSSVVRLFFPNRVFVLDIRTVSVSPNVYKRTIENYFLRFRTLFFRHITILTEQMIDNLKINKSKCHVIPLGSEEISSTNKSFSNLHLFYIGTFNGRRIEDTVEGLSLFLKNNKSVDITYDIIGFGHEFEVKEIEDSIERCKLNDIVTCHGRMDHVDSKLYFDKCNVGISYVPINDYYNLQPPTKIYEYVLSGMACIATDTIESHRLINANNGVLIDDSSIAFSEALGLLLRKSDSFNSIKIRDTLKDYNWSNIIINNMLPFLMKL